MNLFTRVFLILLLFALIPALSTGMWFLRSNARMADNARHLHQQLTQLSADTLEGTIGKLNRSLGFVEDIERTKSKDKVEAFKILQRAVSTYPEFALLSLLDEKGQETVRIANTHLFPEAEYADRSSEPVVLAARKSGSVRLSPVAMTGETPLIRIAYPVSGGRTIYGAYTLEELWQRIQNLRVGGTGRILLLAANGKPLAGFGGDFPEKDWKGPGALNEASGWLDSIKTQQGVLVGAYAKIESLPWRVLSLQLRSEAYAVGDSFVLQAFLFLSLIGAAVALSAFWITGRLTQPLQELIAGARRVSQNEFDQPVPQIGWGELEILSQTFNEMMSTLKSYQDLQVERLVAEKAKVEALIHTIPDGIILASFDGGILVMNASARSILGSSDKATMPKNLSVREALREPAVRDMASSLLRRQKPSASVEFEIKKPSGDRAGIFLCRGVTVTADRREVGILLLFRDVTAEREMDRMKEEFFQSIVHDLRSPLGTIDGFIQIMKDKSNLGEKEKMYLGYVQGSCDRLRQLVTDILETAKMESGQMTLKRRAVQGAEFTTKMRELYTLQAETRGITMAFEDKMPPGVTIPCDHELTERVIMNLIGNAMKFTPKDGRITLTVSQAGQAAEFCIADTGPGIPSDKLEVIFEKFKQLDKGIAVRSGYGLGLSICKKVVELHGGRIWAESQEGKGSRFIFRLPLQPAGPVA